MAPKSTLLCIQQYPTRQPVRELLTRSDAYKVLMTRTGRDGLRLFNQRTVDAVVFDESGRQDEIEVAAKMKRLRPHTPIVLLSDDLYLPDRWLHSVDALVDRSDGPEFLQATLHFLLNARLARH